MVTLRLPTYARREEPLRSRSRRILAIFASGAKRELKRVLNIIVLFLAIAFGVIATIFTIFLAPLINPGQPIDASFFYVTLTNPAVLFLTLIVAAAVGSGLISDDIRHMSLTLYLSRPITTLDYLGAKLFVVGLAVFIAAAFPILLSPIVAAILKYVSWEVALSALTSGLAFGFMAMGLVSFLALMFSSLTARKGVAAAGIIATVLALQALGDSLRSIFEAEELLYMAPYQNLLAVGRALYGVEATDLAWPISLTIILGITIMSAIVAFLRVRSMEVVAP